LCDASFSHPSLLFPHPTSCAPTSSPKPPKTSAPCARGRRGPANRANRSTSKGRRFTVSSRASCARAATLRAATARAASPSTGVSVLVFGRRVWVMVQKKHVRRSNPPSFLLPPLPEKFADENFNLKHDKIGLLSMANAGPGEWMREGGVSKPVCESDFDHSPDTTFPPHHQAPTAASSSSPPPSPSGSTASTSCLAK
jgi:hypothetical protein